MCFWGTATDSTTPFASHGLLHIYIICLALKSWFLILWLLRSRSQICFCLPINWFLNNYPPSETKVGVQPPDSLGLRGNGKTAYDFFQSQLGSPVLREGKKSHSSMREKLKIKQVTLEPPLPLWNSELFAPCLFPLPSQFWAGEQTQRPWRTH